MFRIFPAEIGSIEKVFRIGVFIWFGFMFATSTLFGIGIITEKEIYVELTIFTGPVFAVLTPILFLFALARIILKIISKEYTVAMGYIVYIGLIGLFMLPVVVALYDRYTLFGSISS